MELNFIIYFDLFFIRLSSTHDLSYGFDRLILVYSSYFIYFF
jgi:hypothetical protein